MGGQNNIKNEFSTDEFVADVSPSTAEKQDEQTAVLESVGGFNIPKYDEIAVTYPTTATEVYTYKLATVTKATITVTYSDAVSKLIISGIVKS